MSVRIASLEINMRTNFLTSAFSFLKGTMIAIGDADFTRLTTFGRSPRVSVGSEQTTIAFISRIDSFESALERLAHLLKTALNMKERLDQVRSELWQKFYHRIYYEQNFLSSLGSENHPSRKYSFDAKNLGGEDNDDLYQRIEEFKNRHYSAHRMGLCLQTGLMLDEMQVWSIN